MNRRMIPQSKPSNFKGTMVRLLKSFNKDIWLVIISGIFAILAALLSVILPVLAGKALTSITQIYYGGTDVVNMIPGVLNLNLFEILILTIIIAALNSLLSYLQSYVLIGITQKLTYNMREDLSLKINTLPLNFYDKYKFGDILSRVTNDVDTINQTLTSSFTEIFRTITLVISILVIMFVMSWELASLVTFLVIISMVVASKFVTLSQRFFREAAQNNGEMNGHIEEIYHGHQVVKVFNHQAQAKVEFDDINHRIYDSSWKSQFVSSIMFPVQFFFSNLGYIAIALVGGYLLMHGHIESGFILTYIMYSRRVAQPIQSITQTATILQQTAASAERVFFLLDATDEIDESHKPANVLEKVKGHVVFKDVFFSYLPETPVIQGFSAEIKPGQMVAIVGPTGAGKTTIVNLLMRFYEIDQGAILIDGVNIKDMRREELRNYFGMVLQDTWIFEGTVLENIKYGSEDKSFEAVEKAAKLAQTHHFIHSLPDGYHFKLAEDGLNISAGQRQLITISRAMLRNTPMLILDEATSSVDTRTEILIQKAMDELMKGRTAFVIAHRLSTIKNADIIFVMRNGNIIEQGNHEQLLQQNGFYAELYNSQFEE